MVSRLGADALAGVGVGNQLMQVGISTFFAVSTGTTVLVAYNIGAGNPREAGQAAKQSYFIGILLSMIVAVLGFLFSAPLIRLLGAEPAVVTEGAKFLRIEALGTIFLVTMFISSGILRGSGDTRTPMLVTLSINFINVGVSLPLIFGLGPLPHLGVVGAACGNIVARFIGCVVLVSIVWRGRRGVSIAGRPGWKPRWTLIKRLIDIGLPSMLESLFRSGGMTIFAAVIVSLGTVAYASQQVANIFWQMTLFPGFGFSTAALTLTGQSLGANRPERAALATWVATRACTIWMTSMGIVYFFLGPLLVIPFSAGDPHIRQYRRQRAQGADLLDADSGNGPRAGGKPARRGRYALADVLHGRLDVVRPHPGGLPLRRRPRPRHPRRVPRPHSRWGSHLRPQPLALSQWPLADRPQPERRARTVRASPPAPLRQSKGEGERWMRGCEPNARCYYPFPSPLLRKEYAVWEERFLPAPCMIVWEGA